MTPEHVVVVPSTPALLPEHAGIEDPLPELRAAVGAAVAWLVERHSDEVAVLAGAARADNAARGVTEPTGVRVGRHLLSVAGFEGKLVEHAAGLLVVANGSACRSEKAPGHLDSRAFGFDDAVEQALRAGTPEPLRALDVTLGEELWAFDAPVLRALGDVEGSFQAEVDHAGDPYGVQYWVVRWTCAS